MQEEQGRARWINVRLLECLGTSGNGVEHLGPLLAINILYMFEQRLSALRLRVEAIYGTISMRCSTVLVLTEDKRMYGMADKGLGCSSSKVSLLYEAWCQCEKLHPLRYIVLVVGQPCFLETRYVTRV